MDSVGTILVDSVSGQCWLIVLVGNVQTALGQSWLTMLMDSVSGQCWCNVNGQC